MRNLASIKTISQLLPIKGKDRIVLAIIDGWNVIVKKDEFSVGDQCVYIEIDSVLPEKPEFEFLRSKGFRIKTMKLGETISQGICFPLSILPPGDYKVGQDVTDIIGVRQYNGTMDLDPELQPVKNAKRKYPSFLMRMKWFRRLVLPKKQNLGVSLVPNILPNSTHVEQYHYVKTKSTKSGEIYEENVNEILVSADMEWHWVNNDDPADRIIVPWSMVGQQADASQAFGSGLSYSSRYFMLKYFNVATSDDDPDHWRTLQKEAEETENREIANAIVEQIHALVTEHIDKKPDDRQAIYDITKKFAKDAKGKATIDYRVIQDPVAAGKLLEALSDFLGGVIDNDG